MNEKNLQQPFKFKRDRYRKARGSASAFYNIYCIKCKTWLLLYQKDSPGNLFRLYLDRIFAPENLASIASAVKGKDFRGLSCNYCSGSIGVPMVYEKEKRPAFRLISGTIVKKKSDGTLPAPVIR